MGNNRLRYIDIAKGIAIICVILGHLGNYNINRVVFTFHVPIFFFITGFFISNKRPIKEFIKDKFRILIVPYLLTCLIMVILGTLKGWIAGDAITPLKMWSYASLYGAGDSYTAPFYIPAIGALWFLLATFWGSCFLRISLNFGKYTRIAFIALLFALGYFSRAICWFPLSLQAGACATLFMYMGFLLKSSKEAIDRLPPEVKFFCTVFGSAVWLFFIRDFQSFWLVHCDVGRGIMDIFGCICACSIVIFISKLIDMKTEYISRFLSYFGKYSLLVLCVHSIELNLFPWWPLSEELGLSGFSQLMFLIIAKVAMDLACAYVLSKIAFVKKLYGIKS